MPKDLKEYINVLRKYNQGVDDTELKSYLNSIGYSSNEIDTAFFELSSISMNSSNNPNGESKFLSNNNEQIGQDEIKDATQVVDTSILNTKSFLPELKEDHSIILSNNNSTPNYQESVGISKFITDQINRIQDDNRMNVPNQIISDPIEKNDLMENKLDIQKPIIETSQMSESTPKALSQIVLEDDGNKESKKTSRSILKYIFIIVGVLLIVSSVNYVYFFKPEWFRKLPLTQDGFLSSLAIKVSSIDKTNYNAVFSIDITQRDSNLHEYTPSEEVKRSIDMRTRDESRLKDIDNILNKLNIYFTNNNKFPASLDNLKDISKSDLQQNKYDLSVKDGGSHFSLSFLIESEDVKIYLKNIGLKVNNSLVSVDDTFNFNKPLSVNTLLSYSHGFSVKDSSVALSSDINASFGISGLYIKNQGDNNAKVGINGSFSSGDFNFAVDIETIKLVDDFYLKINKAPSLFGDLSNVKLKWIKVTKQDLFNNWHGAFPSILDDKANEESYKEQVLKILEIANDTNLFVFKEDPVVRNEKLDVFYDYKLKISTDALAVFYEKVTKELENIDKEHPLIKYDELTDFYLKSNVFMAYFDYLSQNQDIVITLNKKGLPVALHYKISILPNIGGKFSDKQINFYLDTTLQNINNDLSVDAPESFITFKDAYLKFTGQTEDEYMVNRQYLSVNNLAQALEQYKFLKGDYPEKISSLVETIESDIQGKKVSNKILDTLPKDQYNGKDFVYKKSSKGDYEIIYTIVVPSKLNESNLSVYTTYDYNNSVTKANSGLPPKIGLKFVNGLNTLTTKLLSVEANDLIKIDTDKDNLSDSLEEFLGKDPKSKDSNKDGIGDYDEYSELIK